MAETGPVEDREVPATDATLVLGTLQGDRSAFGELYDRRARLIRAICYDTTRDLHAAADLTQEVFLRAYRSFSRLRAGSNYRAWLYKIATNCAYTTLKRAGREVDLEDFDRLASHDGHPEKRVIDREATRQLHSLLDELPPKQQAAVVMRYLQELSYAEIAQALDCSEDSARANVYQGIRRLRQETAQEWPEERSDGR